MARGPNVMLGYADDVESTRNTIDADGWLHTGDLGKLDKRGQLVIVGRAKDVIVAANGENVYPDDVEARLGEIEHVNELAIVGIDDPRGGERVACLAVPEREARDDTLLPRRAARAGEALSATRRSASSEERRSVRRSCTLLDAELPRTSTRKVKRAEVKRPILRAPRSSERPPRPTADVGRRRGPARARRGRRHRQAKSRGEITPGTACAPISASTR